MRKAKTGKGSKLATVKKAAREAGLDVITPKVVKKPPRGAARGGMRTSTQPVAIVVKKQRKRSARKPK